VRLQLPPLPPSLRLVSDLEGGEVLLDGKAIGKIEDGEFELQLAAGQTGEHTVEVVGTGHRASLAFDVRPGQAPRLKAPVTTQYLTAAVITGLGSEAVLQGDSQVTTASLNEEALPSQEAGSWRLSGLSEGDHELTLARGRQEHSLTFRSGPAPALTAFLASEPRFGQLRIRTGEDDVRVFLNGRPYRRMTKNGEIVVPVSPSQYTVRVEKNGYEIPAEQVVAVQRGERVSLNFDLAERRRDATLIVRNGFPGAEVMLDGEPLGRIGPNGVLQASGVSPGVHSVLMRKAPYKPKAIEQAFVAGQTHEFDGLLERAVGTLQIDVNRPQQDLRVTLRREGESIERVISDTMLNLAEGTYTVKASAAGYEDAIASVHLSADQIKVASLRLEPRQAEEPAVGLEDWATRPAAYREGETLVLGGEKYALSPNQPTAGTYEFAAKIRKGRRLEWFVNYVNQNNYALYQLSKDYLQRIQVVNGEKSAPFRLTHSLDPDTIVRVQIEVTKDSVVHKIMQNGEWAVIDRMVHTGAGFAEGSFGFHVPGRSEIGLEDFRFIPRI
jgi:hypothetical protein